MTGKLCFFLYWLDNILYRHSYLNQLILNCHLSWNTEVLLGLTLKVWVRSAKCIISFTKGVIWILGCQPWITSVQPSVAPPQSLSYYHRRKQQQQCFANSSCITTQGRVNTMHPCIPNTHTLTHTCSLVRFRREKKTQCCWSELFSPLALLSGPLTEPVMFEAEGAPSLSITD